MYIYLPIAEISLHIAIVIGLGGGVGFLSGMFGVGGGFLMTPLLIFLGMPAPVAVATEANQIVASSVSGVLAHWRRGNVDFKMGTVLLVGGVFGSSLGVLLFALFKEISQIDLVIKLSYVVFLGIVGLLMGMEASAPSCAPVSPGARRGKLHQHNWLHGLPLKMRFRRSSSISVPAAFWFGRFGGRAVCDYGGRGRLYSGAGDDLSAGYADFGGGWHLAVSDYFCYRQCDHPAVSADPDRGFPARRAVAAGGGDWCANWHAGGGLAAR